MIYFYTNVITFLVSYKRKLFNNCISFRHSDTKVAAKNGKSFLASEDDMADVYPLQLRLSVMRETNSLGVKISKKVSSITNSLFLVCCNCENTVSAADIIYLDCSTAITKWTCYHNVNLDAATLLFPPLFLLFSRYGLNLTSINF